MSASVGVSRQHARLSEGVRTGPHEGPEELLGETGEGRGVPDGSQARERPTVTRREFLLNALMITAFGATAVAIADAAIRFLIPPARPAGKAEATEIAKTDEVAPGAAKPFVYDQIQCLLINLNDGFRAFSRVCTHLSCNVDWDPGSHVFACPCHAGVFDANGRNIAGPPPKPLARVKLRVAGDKIIAGGWE